MSGAGYVTGPNLVGAAASLLSLAPPPHTIVAEVFVVAGGYASLVLCCGFCSPWFVSLAAVFASIYFLYRGFSALRRYDEEYRVGVYGAVAVLLGGCGGCYAALGVGVPGSRRGRWLESPRAPAGV